MTRSDSRKALGKGLHSLLPARGAQAPARPPETAAPPDKDRILRAPINQVYPNPNQPRSAFNEAALLDLTHSVGRDGVIQPIIVRRTGPDSFEIVAGERRWRAARGAGLTHIPVIVREADETRALELALIENIQREDLNPIELARAFERMTEMGMTHDEIGTKTGKDRATVTNALRLLQLPDEVQRLIAARRLSPGHARALLKIEGDEERRRIAERSITEGWSVRQIEEYTKPDKAARSGAARAAAPTPPDAASRPDPNVRAAENSLQEIFGTKVRIVEKSRGRGQIEIEYYSADDLQRIYDLISAK